LCAKDSWKLDLEIRALRPSPEIDISIDSKLVNEIFHGDHSLAVVAAGSSRIGDWLVAEAPGSPEILGI